MNGEDLYELVVDYFGRRIQFAYEDGPEPTVGGVLYETFEFECGLDGRYGAFGVEIRVGRQLSTTECFGRAVSRSAEPESIRTSLDTIDRWCRAHLSPEFLTEYEGNLAAESR